MLEGFFFFFLGGVLKIEIIILSKTKNKKYKKRKEKIIAPGWDGKLEEVLQVENAMES